MAKIIKELLKIININLHDILIILGIILFIGTMFNFVSKFAGYMSLSIVFIILGVMLSKLRS